MAETSQLIITLREKGWTDTEITNLILWVGSGDPQYKPKKRVKHNVPDTEGDNMRTDTERLDTQKATVYDLQKLIKSIKKNEGKEEVSINALIDLMDSYIDDCENG